MHAFNCVFRHIALEHCKIFGRAWGLQKKPVGHNLFSTILRKRPFNTFKHTRGTLCLAQLGTLRQRRSWRYPLRLYRTTVMMEEVKKMETYIGLLGPWNVIRWVHWDALQPIHQRQTTDRPRGLLGLPVPVTSIFQQVRWMGCWPARPLFAVRPFSYIIACWLIYVFLALSRNGNILRHTIAGGMTK